MKFTNPWIEFISLTTSNESSLGFDLGVIMIAVL